MLSYFINFLQKNFFLHNIIKIKNIKYTLGVGRERRMDSRGQEIKNINSKTRKDKTHFTFWSSFLRLTGVTGLDLTPLFLIPAMNLTFHPGLWCYLLFESYGLFFWMPPVRHNMLNFIINVMGKFWAPPPHHLIKAALCNMGFLMLFCHFLSIKS